MCKTTVEFQKDGTNVNPTRISSFWGARLGCAVVVILLRRTTEKKQQFSHSMRGKTASTFLVTCVTLPRTTHAISSQSQSFEYITEIR